MASQESTQILQKGGFLLLKTILDARAGFRSLAVTRQRILVTGNSTFERAATDGQGGVVF